MVRDENAGTDETAQPQVENHDWFLHWLIRRYTDAGEDLGITLSVGGMFVTGNVISRKKYFEEFGDKLAPDLWRGRMTSFEEESRRFVHSFGGVAELTQAENNNLPLSQPDDYIHLKDAKMFTPNGGTLKSPFSTYWRIKLSSVDGFALGVLEVTQRS